MVRVSEPVALASLSVRVHTTRVLVVAGIFAALSWPTISSARVRWAILGLRVVVELEWVVVKIRLQIVTCQARNRDASNRGIVAISFVRVVWLCAHVGASRYWETAFG